MVKKSNSKINKKVVILSIIAIICFILIYTTSWVFFIPIAIILWINQRELFGNNN